MRNLIPLACIYKRGEVVLCVIFTSLSWSSSIIHWDRITTYMEISHIGIWRWQRTSPGGFIFRVRLLPSCYVATGHLSSLNRASTFDSPRRGAPAPKAHQRLKVPYIHRQRVTSSTTCQYARRRRSKHYNAHCARKLNRKRRGLIKISASLFMFCIFPCFLVTLVSLFPCCLVLLFFFSLLRSHDVRRETYVIQTNCIYQIRVNLYPCSCYPYSKMLRNPFGKCLITNLDPTDSLPLTQKINFLQPDIYRSTFFQATDAQIIIHYRHQAFR